MSRPPPRSTLFPYTTLFRSQRRVQLLAAWAFPGEMQPAAERQEGRQARRSEEHTSELQSRGHLVCRLLLEKKNECTDQEVCRRLEKRRARAARAGAAGQRRA